MSLTGNCEVRPGCSANRVIQRESPPPHRKAPAMAKHTTYKSTAKAKSETLRRREIRRIKQGK